MPSHLRRTVRTEVIAPEALSPEQVERLVDALYAVHDRVFAGVSRDAFAAYVVASRSRTRILIARDSSGAIVGYTASHIFGPSAETDGVAILRSECGYLPDFRGRALGHALLFAEALRFKLRHPLTPLVGLACPVHPSAYVALGRYCSKMWPHPRRAMPIREQRRLGRLSAYFTMASIEGHPGVRHVGWITRTTPLDGLRWSGSTDLFARFYVVSNPTYEQGSGLLTMVPLSLANLVASGARLFARRFRLRRAYGARCRSGLEGTTGGTDEARPTPRTPLHTPPRTRLLR